MSVGFGFSVGDFITALQLVGQVIDALREVGGAGQEHRELMHELYTLETALINVRRVEVDESLQGEVIALRQAASQCQFTIQNFLKKVQHYQPHLATGGSGSRMKDAWMKIRWAVCKKEDVGKLRADLRGHTGSIEILLSTMQMYDYADRHHVPV